MPPCTRSGRRSRPILNVWAEAFARRGWLAPIGAVISRRKAKPTAMAGVVPAIRAMTADVQMAGTSPAMTVRVLPSDASSPCRGLIHMPVGLRRPCRRVWPTTAQGHTDRLEIVPEIRRARLIRPAIEHDLPAVHNNNPIGYFHRRGDIQSAGHVALECGARRRESDGPHRLKGFVPCRIRRSNRSTGPICPLCGSRLPG